MDDSAANYVELIQQAGIKEQSAKNSQNIKDSQSRGEDKSAQLEPYSGFCLDFQIEFDHPGIPQDTQHYQFEFSSKGYIANVGNARTFGFMRDIEYLQKKTI